MEKKKVVVLTTGGTIMSHYDRSTHTIVQSESVDFLFDAVASFSDAIDIEVHSFCNRPSPHMDAETGMELFRAIHRELAREEIAGAVVAHGTDTIEETAYLISLLLSDQKPVVFTGAMKSSSEEYQDNVGNLLGAIRIAAAPPSRHRGVMVFFHQDILAARYTIKGDTNRMNSFHVSQGGPMGAVINGEVLYFHPPLERECYPVERLHANVQLIKACFDMSPLLIDACVGAKVDGIVIEALGAGNLPPSTLPGIQRALDAGIPVIIASRCPLGPSLAVYDYAGGGARLKSMGCVFSGNLNGTKARIKLMVLLSSGISPSDLNTCFERPREG